VTVRQDLTASQLHPRVQGEQGPPSPLPHILVPLDGSPASEQVLPLVTPLARGLRSRVALLRVLETDALPTTLDREQQHGLDQLVAGAQARSLDYLQGLQTHATTDVLPGSAAEAIVFLAHSLGADLIAMSTHGRTGLGRWMIGSVTEKVLQTADCPVLLVRARSPGDVAAEPPEAVPEPQDGKPEFPFGVTRLLLPLDGSEFAARAIPLAETFSKAFGLPLHVPRVVPASWVALAGSDGDETAAAAAELMTAMEAEAAEYVMRQGSALRDQGLRVETQVVVGDPASEISAMAGQGTMVMMSSHGQTGPGRYVMGSVAGRVVAGSRGPVLVVR